MSADPLDSLILKVMRPHLSPAPEDESVLVHVLNNGAWIEVRGVMAGEPRVPGAVGRWLDSLPHDRRVIVPAVISDRLAGMLGRRGFRQETWYDHHLRVFDKGAWIRGPR